MSIKSEIDRISGNVSDALAATAEMGAEVPSTANSNDLGTLIRSIPKGGAGDFYVNFVDTESLDPEMVMVLGDKTYAEVFEACVAGRTVYAKYTDEDGTVFVLPLIAVQDGMIMFLLYTGSESMTIMIGDGFENYGIIQILDVAGGFDEHTRDNDNPHSVTAAQVGAPTVAEMNTALNGYIPKSGGSLNDAATLKFSRYGNRFLTIDGNSITADMSNTTGGWAGSFASVKDPSGASTCMLGWYGGTSGLTHIYMGGTYNDSFLKFTPAGQFTFKNTPKVGNTSLSLEGHTHSASNVSFSDGETFQQKYDSGELKGEKGDTGATGATGSKGDKGDKGDSGAAGTSCTHSWSGTTLTVTSASGTSSANLKGEKGDKGDKGDTGPAGSNATVTVDSALSSSSTNPVQNKVVNSALAGKAPSYTYGTTDLTAGTSALTTGVLYFVYE